MAKKKEMKEKKEKSVDTLEIARKSIIKKYGEGVISFLGEHSDLKVNVIPTGCLSLDAATGVGGFAIGRLYEIFGPNSSGKSTLALSVIMQALKRDLKNIVYIDAENSLDPQLVRNMGKEVGVEADIDKIEIIRGFCGDDNLEMAERYMKTGEIDVLVVDSVTALLPKSMAEGEIGDNTMGLLARLISKACLKLSPVASSTNTLLIFVNQIRHRIGFFGDTRTPTGGEALSFYSTGRLKIEGGESKKSRIVDDKGVVVGHLCDFTIIKNKLSSPWRTAKIGLIYGKGYDFINEVVSLAVDFGIIDQKGAWFYYNNEKYNGKPALVDLFKENNEIYEVVRNSVKEILGLV